MAKIAKVGYGSDGRGTGATNGEGYTYIVNNNVNVGDMITVISTSRAGKKFPTTGVPLSTHKEGTAKALDARLQAAESGAEEITKVYSGKELCVSGKDKQLKILNKNQIGGVSEYQMATRAAAMGKYQQEHPNAQFTTHAQETFDSYSKPFMQGGQE